MTGDGLCVLFLFTPNSNDIAARRARRLHRLAKLGLEQAGKLQDRMLTAKPSEVAALAAQFEKVARAVRDAISATADLERRRRRSQPSIPDPDSRTVH